MKVRPAAAAPSWQLPGQLSLFVVYLPKICLEHSSAANWMHGFCVLTLSHDPECSFDKGLEAHHTECLAEQQELIEDSTPWHAGSFVSSDEEVTISNKGTASANPQGCQAQPLTEEATLALLPDRYCLVSVAVKT